MALSPFIRRLLCDRGGNVGAMTALFALLLVTAVGGATDFSGVSSTGGKLQDAADSAALAATLALAQNPGATEDQLRAKAQEMAQPARKGLSGKPVDVGVTVEATAPARVRVSLSQDYSLGFGGLLGMRSMRVTRQASAVAGQTVELCMLLLDPVRSDALTVGGTADLTAIRCGIQVNSKGERAVGGHGNAKVKSLKTYVAGPSVSAPHFIPKPVFDQTAVADPFASKMPWPATGVCNQVLGSVGKGLEELPALGPSKPYIICGGISIGNGGTLKLAKNGVYVVQTGSVSIKSGGVLDASEGATLVLTDPSGTVTVQAGGAMKLQGPKQGPWKGVALAVKPQPSEQTSTLIGGGDFELDGIVYMPTQKLELTGGASVEKKESPRAFVANRLELSGNGKVFLRAMPSTMTRGTQVRLVN